MAKLPTLNQLRETAERANDAIAEVASDAAAAIETLNTAKADAPIWSAKTVAASAWVTNTDTAVKNAGYNYMADIAYSGITAADSAECIIYPASAPTAIAAGICPTSEVIAGAIRLYARSIPTAAISIQVRPILDMSTTT